MFRNVDVLVVVDDWKGSGAASSLEPCYFCARSFSVADPDVGTLYRRLHQAGAQGWHASGDRSRHGFLFNSPLFEQIVQNLDVSTTCRYDLLTDATDFESEKLRASWALVLQRKPELQPVWRGADQHGMALFRFVEFLARDFEEKLAHGARVRIVVDRLSWLEPHLGSAPQVADGVHRLACGGENVDLDLLVLSDKSATGAAPYLPLLGLVDSETWAFGRLNELKLKDGSSIRQRYIQWRTEGAPPDALVVSDAEFEQAFLPHERHPQLRSYWQRLVHWPEARSVAFP